MMQEQHLNELCGSCARFEIFMSFCFYFLNILLNFTQSLFI